MELGGAPSDIGVQACETSRSKAPAGKVFNYLPYIDVPVLQVPPLAFAAIQ